VVIKLFFVLLVLGTLAIAGVCLAIHLRVKRHLRQEQMEAQVRSVLESVAESAVEKEQAQ